ncbi:replication factor A protein 3, putative [Plasmodium malariae]|uniref:Replication factor A protein 3, putative n=1 Tax=Plasmodium malariae TaxID=5858 RepID=A0A1C3L1T8_PLAMA|nr:replication factor A protein 3, putative [Plasmodium malariae]SBT80510.1 replication factor A protein 3, putative [Plasmodium malariae]SCO94151.1 replication factor A protein 3, putative [Plasmodium malariae]
MDQFVAPRVNKKYLSKFYNKNVRIIGKVLKKDGNELTLLTCDNEEVKCFLNDDQMADSFEHYVEVLGKVNEDETLSDIVYVQNGGNSLNLNEMNNLVNLTFLEEFVEIF